LHLYTDEGCFSDNTCMEIVAINSADCCGAGGLATLANDQCSMLSCPQGNL